MLSQVAMAQGARILLFSESLSLASLVAMITCGYWWTGICQALLCFDCIKKRYTHPNPRHNRGGNQHSQKRCLNGCESNPTLPV